MSLHTYISLYVALYTVHIVNHVFNATRNEVEIDVLRKSNLLIMYKFAKELILALPCALLR